MPSLQSQSPWAKQCLLSGKWESVTWMGVGEWPLVRWGVKDNLEPRAEGQ